jgi:hypothetical protein
MFGGRRADRAAAFDAAGNGDADAAGVGQLRAGERFAEVAGGGNGSRGCERAAILK